MAIDQLRYPVRPRRGERRCRPRANQHRLETVRPPRATRFEPNVSAPSLYFASVCRTSADHQATTADGRRAQAIHVRHRNTLAAAQEKGRR